MDNRSIKERLKEKGFIVTDITGKSLGIRKIIDFKGNDYGFLTPLECLELIKDK